jgi:hypothetical protein
MAESTYEVTVQRPDGRRYTATVNAKNAKEAREAVEADLDAERPPAATVVEVHKIK